MSEKDKVNWDQVKKWVSRAGLKTQWKPYGMPEVLDPYTSRFVDVDPLPKWQIPPKVMISSTITGAFFSKRANPNQPITTDEIRASAEECIKAGAPNIHIHVRDEGGFNVLDPQPLPRRDCTAARALSASHVRRLPRGGDRRGKRAHGAHDEVRPLRRAAGQHHRHLLRRQHVLQTAARHHREGPARAGGGMQADHLGVRRR